MAFYSFDIQEFMSAINNHDYTRIRACFVNAILNDPLFLNNNESEVKRAYNILQNKKELIPELWQTYRKFVEEPDFENEDEWDYDSFIQKTFYLTRNFNVKRINELGRIGRSLARQGKLPNFQEPQEPENSHSPQPERVRERVNRRVSRISQEQTETLPFNPAIALGIMALVVIVIFLVVRLKN